MQASTAITAFNAIPPAAIIEHSLLAEPPAPETAPKKRANPAAVVGLVIIGVLVGLVAWYPASDRAAPYATSASVTASVTQISPRVSGPVQTVFVKDNAEVSIGSPLFQIDTSTYQMDVAQAEAQLRQIQQTNLANQQAVRSAEAQHQRSLATLKTAEQAWDRASALLKQGLLSKAKASEAEGAFVAAKASAEAASADLAKFAAQAGPDGADNPQLQAAEVAVERARFALNNSVVLAPAGGFVTNLTLSVGQYATAGQPALTFIDKATTGILADFRENQLVNVLPGAPAEIMFEAYPNHVYRGHVESIAWGINSGRTSVNGLAQSSTDTRWFPPARKIPVRVTLDNPDELPHQVRLGSEASVLIYAQGEEGLVPTVSRWLMGISSMLSGMY